MFIFYDWGNFVILEKYFVCKKKNMYFFWVNKAIHRKSPKPSRKATVQGQEGPTNSLTQKLKKHTKDEPEDLCLNPKIAIFLHTKVLASLVRGGLTDLAG